MAGLKARIIILICHIEGIFHKLIRNQATEYIENSIFQLCKKEPLRKSCCFLALCSSCIARCSSKLKMIPCAMPTLGTRALRITEH